jgi:predicted transcriptional regulator
MVRTQIYITEDEEKCLEVLSNRSGRKKSDLIRNAIDDFIARTSVTPKLETIKKFRGIWQDRAESGILEARHEVEKRIRA